MDERKLFTNTFIDTDVYKVKDNPDKYLKEQEEFKRFIENKNPDIGNINFVTSAQQRSNIVEKSETIQDMLGEKQQLVEQVLIDDNNKYNTIDNKTNNMNYKGTKNGIDYNNLKTNKNMSDNNYIQLRKKYLTINSSDRNTSFYPFPNNYKITLNQELFENIISIKLKNTNFKNTEQTIYKSPLDETNNKIHFTLYTDNYVSYATYIATLEFGLYSYEELAEELERAMNYEIQKDGTFSDYEISVTIDSKLNYVVFNAYKWTNIPYSLRFFGTLSNGSSTLNVVYPNHGLSAGDTFTLRNVSELELPPFIVTLEDDYFNKKYIVDNVVDTNTIEAYPQQSPPYASGVLFREYSTGDVSSVDNKTEMNARIAGATLLSTTVTSDINGTISTPGGMVVFSGYIYITIPGTYTFRSNSDDASDVFINNTAVSEYYGNHSAANGSNNYPITLDIGYYSLDYRVINTIGTGSYVLYYTPPGGSEVLVPSSVFFNDEFSTQYTSETPSAGNNYKYLYTGGGAIQTGVPLNMEIYFGSSDSVARILGFPETTIRSLDVGIDYEYTTIPDDVALINSITYEKSISNNQYIRNIDLNYVLPYEGGNRTLVNTISNHLLSTGDRITIAEGPQDLIIYQDGITSTTITTTDFFYLNLSGTTTPATAKDSANEALRDSFTDSFKNLNGYLIENINSKEFVINVPYIDYEIEDPDNPGEYINMSDYTEKEIVGTTDIVRGTILVNSKSTLDIDGNEYVYMTSDILGGNFTSSNDSSNLQNIFAKIQYVGEPGEVGYNAYIGGQKFYYDTPLNRLTEIDFEFKDIDGNRIDFKNVDHSFTLEIIEVIQKVEGTDYNARLGNQISLKN